MKNLQTFEGFFDFWKEKEKEETIPPTSQFPFEIKKIEELIKRFPKHKGKVFVYDCSIDGKHYYTWHTYSNNVMDESYSVIGKADNLEEAKDIILTDYHMKS